MAESRQDHTTADPICRDKYVETVSNALVDLIGTKRAQGRYSNTCSANALLYNWLWPISVFRRVNLGSLMKACDEMGVSKESSWPNFMEQRALKEHLQQVKLWSV